MEDQTGEALILRRKSGLLLTDEGVRLYSLAIEIFDVIDRYSSTNHIKSEKLIKIAASEILCIHLLPSVIKRTCHQFPKAKFEIVSSTAEKIEDRVLNFESDLGFSFHAPKSNSLKYVKLGNVSFALVVSKKLNISTIKQLKGLRYIGSRQADYSRPYFALSELRKHSIHVETVVETDSLETQIKMADLGLGFTVAPKFILSKNLNLKSLEGFKSIATLYGVRRQRKLIPEHEALLSSLKDIVRDDDFGL